MATRGDNKADHHSSRLQPRPGQHTQSTTQTPALLLVIITHSLVALSRTNAGCGCINPVDMCDGAPAQHSRQLPLQSCCFSFLLLGSLHQDPGPWLCLCWALCVAQCEYIHCSPAAGEGELGGGGLNGPSSAPPCLVLPSSKHQHSHKQKHNLIFYTSDQNIAETRERMKI